MRNRLCPALLGIALACIGALATACEGLTITDAWIREPPPGAKAVALYMRLGNEGDGSVVVDAVSSPSFEHGMLHETVTDGDRVSMRHVDELRLAPGEQVELAPGGLHAMLVKPVAGTPSAGTNVDITIGCAEATRSVSVPVRRQ